MVRSHHIKACAQSGKWRRLNRSFSYGREQATADKETASKSTPTDLFLAMARPRYALATGNALPSGFSFSASRPAIRRDKCRRKIPQAYDSSGKLRLSRRGRPAAAFGASIRRYRADTKLSCDC